jgi:uncharacterized delta-60 repeat protein
MRPPRILNSLRSWLAPALLLPLPLLAAPGDPDPSFGSAGVAVTDFDDTGDEVRTLLVRSDGKILAGGSAGQYFAFARYHGDGTPDTSFMGNGKVAHPIQGAVQRMALQPDGKIVAIGGPGTPYSPRLARFATDGSLDTGFGNQGSVILDLIDSRLTGDVVVRGDGSILVSGSRAANPAANDYHLVMAVSCYLPNGTLDPNFGNGGHAHADMVREATPTTIALDAQNRLLVAGYRDETSGDDLAIARFLPNGTLDPSFDGDGRTTVSLGYIDEAVQVAALPDGKILLAALADGYAAIVRLLPDGTPDLSFDSDGKAVTTVSLGGGYQGNFAGAALLPDGGMAMAGRNNNVPNQFAVLKFRADGTIDTSFNGTGLATPTLGSTYSRSMSVAALPSGKILAAGLATFTTRSDFAIARLLVTGPGAKLKPPFGYYWNDATQFGSAYVRGTPTLRTFTLENQGTETLGSFSIGFDGTGAADFSATSTLPETLAPGASVTFQIAFAPQAAGVRTANLRLHSNDPTRNPFTLALTGTGLTRPLIRVELPDGTPIEKSNDHAGGLIDFGAFPIGVPVDLTLTIRNPGSANLTGLNVSTAGLDANQFTIVTQPVAPVAPDGSTTLTVRFTPASFGEKTAPLRIPSNADSQFYIRMIGTGKAPSMVMEGPGGAILKHDVDSVTFGGLVSGNPVTHPVTIRNAGSENLILTSLTLGEQGAGYFETSPLPGAPVPPGGSVVMNVTFHPTSQGQHVATLTLTGNDPAKPEYKVYLVGEAQAPFIQVYDDYGHLLDVEGDVSRFDPVLPGESDMQTFWIGNLGNADLTGVSVTLAGEHAETFSIAASPPPVIGPWGQGAPLIVRFSAPAAGSRTAELRIHSSDPAAPLWTIPLHAEARQAETSGDGKLDPAFGSTVDGEPLFPGVESAYGYRMLVQPDGKIVLLGTRPGPEEEWDILVARLMPDGTPDPSFDGDGQALIDLGDYELLSAADLQSDGSIVIAGYSGDEIVVLRLLANGSLDSTFGSGGVISSPADGLEFIPEEMKVRSDGTIIIAGRRHDYDDSSEWITPVLVGLLADGSPNLDFGDAGVVIDPLIRWEQWDLDIEAVIQSDGSILVAGSSGGRIQLMHFLASGDLDPAFGDGGSVEIPHGDWAGLDCITLQADGRILLGGSTFVDDKYYNLVLRRLPDGSPDPDFGTAGATLLDFRGSYSLVDLIALPDGGVIGAIEMSRDGLFHVGVTRLNGNGLIDTSFGDGGLAIAPPSTNPVLGLAADGDLLMAARAYGLDGQSEAGLGLFRFALGLPAEGTFEISPSSDVQAGDLLDGLFSGWTSDHAPLSYQILVNNLPVAPASTNPGIAFQAPMTPGLHQITGRIIDALGEATEVTRSLRVVMTGAMWQQLHFAGNPEISGDDDDPDADGRSNLLEFATGGDPRSSEQTPENIQLSGDLLVLTYLRNKSAVFDGVTFSVEWSESLFAQNWSTATVTENVLDLGDSERVTATVPAGNAGRRFVRLRVERP